MAKATEFHLFLQTPHIRHRIQFLVQELQYPAREYQVQRTVTRP